MKHLFKLGDRVIGKKFHKGATGYVVALLDKEESLSLRSAEELPCCEVEWDNQDDEYCEDNVSVESESALDLVED